MYVRLFLLYSQPDSISRAAIPNTQQESSPKPVNENGNSTSTTSEKPTNPTKNTQKPETKQSQNDGGAEGKDKEGPCGLPAKCTIL